MASSLASYDLYYTAAIVLQMKTAKYEWQTYKLLFPTDDESCDTVNIWSEPQMVQNLKKHNINKKVSDKYVTCL